jgi:membrane glycosyltransferase
VSPGRIRGLFAALLLGPVVVVVALIGRVLSADGLGGAEIGLLGLYAILLSWIGSGFWFCVFGLFGRRRDEAPAGVDADDHFGPSLTAIVIPVFHEDPEAVFARIRVMYASLERTGRINSFEFFILSDSRDPAFWQEESRAWFAACLELHAFHRLFYRRRPDNHARKSGNIEEFCRGWGGRYDYMIVLDADSLMAGDTMVEMVRRMEADPRLGLLQTSPVCVRGRSLFARIQQFAGSVYGELLTRGLSRFLGLQGTYWGHNAIIRMRAFARCCALPPLPGREPLGGLIMSHDFVEAALLVGAGWRVRFDADLKGSFEEGPPSLIDHAARDRRWCQGNLQHGYLLFAKGLHPMSRLNFLAGIMSYASGPLWLAFMTLALAMVAGGAGSDLAEAWRAERGALLGVLGFTGILLFGTKLASLAFALSDDRRRRRFGGGARLILGVVLESLFSILIAPVMMALHTRFVASVLAGRNSGWGPQRRDAEEVGWRHAARTHGGETLLGLCLGAFLLFELPELSWWLLPVIAGLILSVPISVLSSRASLGGAARKFGLLLVPAEVAPSRELRELARLLSRDDRERETPYAAPQLHLIPEPGPETRRDRLPDPLAVDRPAPDHEIPAWLLRQRNAG